MNHRKGWGRGTSLLLAVTSLFCSTTTLAQTVAPSASSDAADPRLWLRLSPRLSVGSGLGRYEGGVQRNGVTTYIDSSDAGTAGAYGGRLDVGLTYLSGTAALRPFVGLVGHSQFSQDQSRDLFGIEHEWQTRSAVFSTELGFEASVWKRSLWIQTTLGAAWIFQRLHVGNPSDLELVNLELGDSRRVAMQGRMGLLYSVALNSWMMAGCTLFGELMTTTRFARRGGVELMVEWGRIQ